VLVVAAILFVASLILRGPQATPLLRGTIVVVLVLGLLTTMLDWVAFRWLLGYVVTGVVVAIPVVFQSELRRALERVGRTGWSSFLGARLLLAKMSKSLKRSARRRRVCLNGGTAR